MGTADYDWAAVVQPGTTYRTKSGRKLIVDRIEGVRAVMINFQVQRGAYGVSRVRIDRLNPKEGYTPIGVVPPLKKGH